MSIKVKICGITNLQDALKAVESGADALGFIFYKASPRYITPAKAASIISGLPSRIIKTGVFVNAREKTIRRVAKLCALNLIQLHGEETPRFCKRLKDLRVIKAFRVKDVVSPGEIVKYNTFAYLFDAHANKQKGGTGKTFNWKLIEHPDFITRPIFLSGGLNGLNVQKAIKTLHPHWVDVSTGVESAPGRKDHKKIKMFVQAAKR
ncbi:MAG: phosphoribosylanthranilate isomerase [Candidatus Omnitrophota bacterium]